MEAPQVKSLAQSHMVFGWWGLEVNLTPKIKCLMYIVLLSFRNKKRKLKRSYVTAKPRVGEQENYLNESKGNMESEEKR